MPFDPTSSFVLPSALIKSTISLKSISLLMNLWFRKFFTLQIFIISRTYLIAILQNLCELQKFSLLTVAHLGSFSILELLAIFVIILEPFFFFVKMQKVSC